MTEKKPSTENETANTKPARKKAPTVAKTAVKKTSTLKPTAAKTNTTSVSKPAPKTTTKTTSAGARKVSTSTATKATTAASKTPVARKTVAKATPVAKSTKTVSESPTASSTKTIVSETKATRKKLTMPKTDPETAKALKDLQKETDKKFSEALRKLELTAQNASTKTRRTKTQVSSPLPAIDPHEPAAYYNNGVISFVKYTKYPILLSSYNKIKHKIKTREYLTTLSLMLGLITIISTVPVLVIGIFFAHPATITTGIIAIIVAFLLTVALPYYLTQETTKELTQHRNDLLKSLSRYALDSHDIKVSGADILNSMLSKTILTAFTKNEGITYYSAIEEPDGIFLYKSPI